MKIEMTLLEVLKSIRDLGPALDSVGICLNVGPHKEEFLDLAQGWPKHSGARFFPVPMPSFDPAEAYTYLTLWVGEYGARRMELVNWCIEQLESRNEN